MKSMSFFLTLFMLHSVVVSAGEIPSLFLDEGVNEVSIKVTNNWDSDLNDLTFNVDPVNVPDWLSISDNDQVINVTHDSDGTGRFYVYFNVLNAPEDAYTEIQYVLRDKDGNEWSFALKLKINDQNEETQPLATALYENYPNPFNPSTTIRYSLSENLHTNVVVYNTLGQTVRTLVNEHVTAGMHTIEWDGRNDLGQKVSSGMYIYKLTAGSYVSTKRMMLIE